MVVVESGVIFLLPSPTSKAQDVSLRVCPSHQPQQRKEKRELIHHIHVLHEFSGYQYLQVPLLSSVDVAKLPVQR